MLLNIILTACLAGYTFSAVAVHIPIALQTHPQPCGRIAGEVSETVVPVLTHHATVWPEEVWGTLHLEAHVEENQSK